MRKTEKKTPEAGENWFWWQSDYILSWMGQTQEIALRSKHSQTFVFFILEEGHLLVNNSPRKDVAVSFNQWTDSRIMQYITLTVFFFFKRLLVLIKCASLHYNSGWFKCWINLYVTITTLCQENFTWMRLLMRQTWFCLEFVAWECSHTPK